MNKESILDRLVNIHKTRDYPDHFEIADWLMFIIQCQLVLSLARILERAQTCWSPSKAMSVTRS